MMLLVACTSADFIETKSVIFKLLVSTRARAVIFRVDSTTLHCIL